MLYKESYIPLLLQKQEHSITGLVLFKNPKQKPLKQNFLHRNERSEYIAFWCNGRCFFIKVEGSSSVVHAIAALTEARRGYPVCSRLPGFTPLSPTVCFKFLVTPLRKRGEKVPSPFWRFIATEIRRRKYKSLTCSTFTISAWWMPTFAGVSQK